MRNRLAMKRFRLTQQLCSTKTSLLACLIATLTCFVLQPELPLLVAKSAAAPRRGNQALMKQINYLQKQHEDDVAEINKLKQNLEHIAPDMVQAQTRKKEIEASVVENQRLAAEANATAAKDNLAAAKELARKAEAEAQQTTLQAEEALAKREAAELALKEATIQERVKQLELELHQQRAAKSEAEANETRQRYEELELQRDTLAKMHEAAVANATIAEKKAQQAISEAQRARDELEKQKEETRQAEIQREASEINAKAKEKELEYLQEEQRTLEMRMKTLEQQKTQFQEMLESARNALEEGETEVRRLTSTRERELVEAAEQSKQSERDALQKLDALKDSMSSMREEMHNTTLRALSLERSEYFSHEINRTEQHTLQLRLVMEETKAKLEAAEESRKDVEYQLQLKREEAKVAELELDEKRIKAETEKAQADRFRYEEAISKQEAIAINKSAEEAKFRLEEVKSRENSLRLQLQDSVHRKEKAVADLKTAQEQATKAHDQMIEESRKAESSKAELEIARRHSDSIKLAAEKADSEMKHAQAQNSTAMAEVLIWQEKRLIAEIRKNTAEEERGQLEADLQKLQVNFKIEVERAKAALEERLKAETELHDSSLKLQAEAEKREAAEAHQMAQEAEKYVVDRSIELENLKKNSSQEIEDYRTEQARILAKEQAAQRRLEQKEENKAYLEREERLISKKEESSIRQEEKRRETERELSQINYQKEIEQAKIRAQIDAESRIKQERENEDVILRQKAAEAEAITKQWVTAIQATSQSIGEGFQAMLGRHLARTIAGITAFVLAGMIAKELANAVGAEFRRIMGQPTLVRESSRPVGIFESIKWSFWSFISIFQKSKTTDGFSDVVLEPKMSSAIRSMSVSTRNAKRNHAPLRHFMFYGPPGTGKTMVAQRLARNCGLDYAIMSGGDVAPLGANAVAEIHKLFEWAKRSRKGLLLFIDEADAFLGTRTRENVSEHMRNVLSALLYQTGTQSQSYMIVLATNRPEDLDSAITDRVDQALHFDLPDSSCRRKMIAQYFEKNILSRSDVSPTSIKLAKSISVVLSSNGSHSFTSDISKNKEDSVEVVPGSHLYKENNLLRFLGCQSRGPPGIRLEEAMNGKELEKAVGATEGFSGRQLSKLMLNYQGAVYSTETCIATVKDFRTVLQDEEAKLRDMKLAEQVHGYGHGLLNAKDAHFENLNGLKSSDAKSQSNGAAT